MILYDIEDREPTPRFSNPPRSDITTPKVLGHGLLSRTASGEPCSMAVLRRPDIWRRRTGLECGRNIAEDEVFFRGAHRKLGTMP